MILRNEALRNFLSRLAALFVMLVAPAVVRAQCAMCQTSAANSDPAGIRYLNYATVLLLAPPVALFCVFFYIAYKRRNAPEDEARREEDRRIARAEKSRAEVLARVRPSN
jgi:hypothetical protein